MAEKEVEEGEEERHKDGIGGRGFQFDHFLLQFNHFCHK
jgi:hypothetical protein